MRLYDKKKIDWNNILFNNRALFLLLVPIIVEQLLNSFMGMVDTMMVSTVGSEAISAVSLVDSFNNLVVQVFSAMAARLRSSARSILEAAMSGLPTMRPDRSCSQWL